MTAALATALDSSSVKPVFIAKFEFPGGDVRFWTGSGDLVWNAETYTGLGDLGQSVFPEESSDGSASGAVFTLSGIPSTNTNLALTENYQNSPCSVWLGALDSSDLVIADPYLIFKGLMDVMDMTDDGELATIQLRAEGFAYGVGPSNRRYTDEDQQREYTGDDGLHYAASLQDKEIMWGIQNPSKNISVYEPVFDEDDVHGWDVP